MSEPQDSLSTGTLGKVVNPVFNMEQQDTQVLDTSVNNRYYVKYHPQTQILPETQQVRFLCQNKVDFLQLSETIFRVQFRVGTLDVEDKVTFADDVVSFFESVEVRLSNTVVEGKTGIPDIAATERLFWSDQVRNTTGRMRLAYDDTFRTPGSVASYYPINYNLTQPGAQGQGQILVGTKNATTNLTVAATSFNNFIAGNGVKWYMSRDDQYVEGCFRLSDICDMFKSYRSVTRGVTLEVILNKSPNYRCLQYGEGDPVYATSQLEWALPNMNPLPPSDDIDPRAEGITMWVPVYRPSPVMLNILETKLARSGGIKTDVMFERANVYTSGVLQNLANTWRVVVTPFKITKAIVFFRQYNTDFPNFKTFQTLHSMHSSGRMTRVSMDLNGNVIPKVNPIPSYFNSTWGQGHPDNPPGTVFNNPPLSNTPDEYRTANADMMYVEYLKMCHALEASYPSSNYTGAAGLSYEDFCYLYPTYCFQVSENYGESEANDRQSSSLILNWESSGAGPDGTLWPAPNTKGGFDVLEAIVVVFTLHECNVITGSAQESVVRCL